MRDRARWGRTVSLAVAGMVAGSLLLTPAAAHLNSPLTFKHLKKHFYTKGAADARFLNVGESYLKSESDTKYLGTVKTIIVNDSISAGSKRTDALCPAGYVAIGGGYNFSSNTPAATVVWDEPLINGDNLSAASAGENPAPNGWGVRVVNGSGTNTYSVGVVCIT